MYMFFLELCKHCKETTFVIHHQRNKKACTFLQQIYQLKTPVELRENQIMIYYLHVTLGQKFEKIQDVEPSYYIYGYIE